MSSTGRRDEAFGGDSYEVLSEVWVVVEKSGACGEQPNMSTRLGVISIRRKRKEGKMRKINGGGERGGLNEYILH